MARIGHKLTIQPDGKYVVATCECGKWRRALLMPDEPDMLALVGTLTGRHHRHLERLGRRAGMGASGEGPLVPDDPPTK